VQPSNLVIVPSELYVENFGPIKNGHIVFSNFTVICGRQGTGKSYLALLVYAFMKFSTRVICLVNDAVVKTIYENYGNGTYSRDFILKIVQEKSDDIRKKIHSEFLTFLKSSLEHVVKSTFGLGLRELIERGSSDLKISFSVNAYLSKARSEVGYLSLSLNVSKDKDPSIERLDISDNLITTIAASIDEVEISRGGWMFRSRLNIVDLTSRLVYVPAERIGIMSSLYSMIEFMIRLYGLRQFLPDIARLVEDGYSTISKPILFNFIRRLLESFKNVRIGKYDLPIAGKISIEWPKLSIVPMIEYYDDTRNVSLPLALSPSGVAQLTPIVILLEQLHEGFIIIEEPEINLHPDAHLRVAEWLAEYYRRGNVSTYLITTHSPFLLSKLALLYSRKYIDNLRVYLVQDNGTIQELEIKHEKGEIELPQSIVNAYAELAKESLELAGLELLNVEGNQHE